MDQSNLVSQYGLLGVLNKVTKLLINKSKYQFYKRYHKNVQQYRPPTPAELDTIEHDLCNLGIEVQKLRVEPNKFSKFKSSFKFPTDYHGGIAGGVWEEKLFEHFLAYELAIKKANAGDIYVDVAACSSPWAFMLREQKGINAYAIDLNVSNRYQQYDYYLAQDATDTSFEDESISSASLQCAFEMFKDDDDINLIKELSRILRPGGRAIVSPLYMHTHYCSYSSPEYWGKHYSDPEAKEYIRTDIHNVPSSRKYNAKKLKERVLDTLHLHGMDYKLYRIENKAEIDSSIYCHFVLEIIK